MQIENRQRKKHAGGRPRKFSGASHPITVTLPDAILEKLKEIDVDRARAIVKATEATLGLRENARAPIQVVEVSPGAGLIIVGPSQYLKKIPWLRMAEIAPARYILSIPTGTPVDSLEIAIADILDELPDTEQHDHAMLTELRELMRGLRRAEKVTKAEILYVSTSRKSHRY